MARAIFVLAGLGAFFYASYGFANWLASTRASVPSVVFHWESHIPFLEWTIIPYWSTNLFYAGSILASRSRAELAVHARRLLTAQIIAIAFFITVPLKFSWPKPETAGLYGFMFDALGAFDKPFNQAPSLHVALTVIFVARFANQMPRRMFSIFLGWSVLVIASVMTTFQHHFIDIPTGLLLGLFCLWLWRDDGTSAFGHWLLTADRRRINLAVLYGLGAILFGISAIAFGGAALWLLWPAVALIAVASAYLGFGPHFVMKGSDGTIGWPIRIILAPYLAAAWLNSRLWTRTYPAQVEIADGVHIGRFPDSNAASQFQNIVDLTAEFNKPIKQGNWKSVPMLDLVAPDAQSLRDAAEAIKAAQGSKSVLVCCALGLGRSAAAIVVWLVISGRARDFRQAVETVAACQPRIAIHASLMRSIEEAIHGA